MRGAIGNTVFVVGLGVMLMASWLVARRLPRGRTSGVVRRWVLRDLADSRDRDAIRDRATWWAAAGFALMLAGLWMADGHL